MTRSEEEPFREIKANLPGFYENWVLSTFANGSSFRMFKDFSKVRSFLRKYGPVLTREQGHHHYDRTLEDLATKFCRSEIRLSNGGKPKLGHALKILNLFVKHYCSMPYFIGSRNTKRARSLMRRAHVPLDRIVLKAVWKDFRPQLQKRIKTAPKLGALKKKEYRTIQTVLRSAAKTQKLPAVAYDFRWSEGRT